MTLKAIADAVASDVGLRIPSEVVGSADREMIELVAYANEAGKEIARRVDWGKLTSSTTVTGTGAAVAHAMPAGFSRLVQGIAVLNASGNVVRQLSRPEWDALMMVEGVPRYFLLEGDTLRLWPFLASGQAATVYYQSGYWVSGGTDEWSADDQEPVIPQNLLVKGTIVRWRRQKRMEYADYEAEYEAALADAARFDDGSRL